MFYIIIILSLQCIFVMFLVHPLFTSSVPLSMCCIIIDKLYVVSHSFLSFFVHVNTQFMSTLFTCIPTYRTEYISSPFTYVSLVSRTEEYYFPLRNQSTLLRGSRCGLTLLHEEELPTLLFATAHLTIRNI